MSINKQILNVDQVSSGQKEIIPLVVILQELTKLKQPLLLIIEEPESHLFPRDQRELFNLIIEMANKTGSKVFITTHSNYLLMSVNNLIHAEAKKYEKLRDRYIAFANINVHKLVDGISESILDQETKHINAEYIEAISDEVMEEYDNILDNKK